MELYKYYYLWCNKLTNARLLHVSLYAIKDKLMNKIIIIAFLFIISCSPQQQDSKTTDNNSKKIGTSLTQNKFILEEKRIRQGQTEQYVYEYTLYKTFNSDTIDTLFLVKYNIYDNPAQSFCFSEDSTLLIYKSKNGVNILDLKTLKNIKTLDGYLPINDKNYNFYDSQNKILIFQKTDRKKGISAIFKYSLDDNRLDTITEFDIRHYEIDYPYIFMDHDSNKLYLKYTYYKGNDYYNYIRVDTSFNYLK
jgi:hypothetical protein